MEFIELYNEKEVRGGERPVVFAMTDLAFGEWLKVFGDVMMTDMLLDKHTHHCKTIETGYES